VPIGGDSWFWSDDNAKVLEFLLRPELWRRFPEETAEILRFVRAMCRGPLIFRRVSRPMAKWLSPIPTSTGRYMRRTRNSAAGKVSVGIQSSQTKASARWRAATEPRDRSHSIFINE
jgi:hypothetical protein